MNATPSVSAVIVTYNRLEKLKSSLCALQQQEVDTIIVVNNNSTDQTASWLQKQNDQRLHIINLEENTGGAGGFHTGVKHAVEKTDTDWVLCLDDDAYPAKDAIEQFKQHYSNTNADIVAAAVYSLAGTIPDMNRPIRKMPTSIWSMLSYFINRDDYIINNDDYQIQQPAEIDASSFVGIFIKSSSAKKLFGYPRSELFLYCDDLIYTYSARRKGAHLVFDPRIRFIHDCDEQMARLYQQSWKVYYLARNYTELYRIANDRQYLWMSIVRFIFIISKITISKRKYLYLIHVITGFRDGIRSDFLNAPRDINDH